MNTKIVTINRLKEFLNKFSKVATSGNYSDLSEIPTKVSQFTNDAGYVTLADFNAAIANLQAQITNNIGRVLTADPSENNRVWVEQA